METIWANNRQTYEEWCKTHWRLPNDQWTDNYEEYLDAKHQIEQSRLEKERKQQELNKLHCEIHHIKQNYHNPGQNLKDPFPEYDVKIFFDNQGKEIYRCKI